MDEFFLKLCHQESQREYKCSEGQQKSSCLLPEMIKLLFSKKHFAIVFYG
jgi:hypothetical protein